MWVLEAWQDAEKVWYPVVWEEKKDASNIIDYDIHEEITKDASNVINANNDTTTGMANVIPWINAPKLIANTSIIWDLWWEPWSAWALLTWSIGFHSDSGWVQYIDLTTFTISNEIWDLHYTQWYNWIIMPKNATYNLKITYPTWWSSWKFDVLVKNNDTVLSEMHWWYDNTQYTDELFVYMKKWSRLWADVTVTMPNNITWSRNMTINIQSIT